LDVWNQPFPGNQSSDSFNVASIYSFHKYGSFSAKPCDTFGPTCKSEAGYGLRNAYDNAQSNLATNGHGDLPVYITEFNCYTAMGADAVNQPYLTGKNVMDMTATASCVAAEVGSLVRFPDSPQMINLHKIVQTLLPTVPSGVAKNGM